MESGAPKRKKTKLPSTKRILSVAFSSCGPGKRAKGFKGTRGEAQKKSKDWKDELKRHVATINDIDPQVQYITNEGAPRSERYDVIVSHNGKRSLRVLFGIVQGNTKIVSSKFVWTSLSRGKWQDPEKYQVFEAFPALKTSQIRRREETRGLFEGLRFYVTPRNEESKPSASILKELVQAGDGKVCMSLFCSTHISTCMPCVGVRYC